MSSFVGRVTKQLKTAFGLGSLLLLCSCGSAQKQPSDEFAELRKKMVETQIVARDIKDKRVLDAMQSVPRHRFVPEEFQAQSYEDYPIPIGDDQTISQPYIVAFMSEGLRLKPDDKVLEIGTGSGYQSAILSRLAKEVFSVEILEQMGRRAQQTLAALGYTNVQVKIGDGYQGWPEKAPFNAIIVTAAPDHIPQALIDQLAPGGRLIVPVGTGWQSLVRVTRTASGKFERETLLPVRFVPMTGEACTQHKPAGRGITKEQKNPVSPGNTGNQSGDHEDESESR